MTTTTQTTPTPSLDGRAVVITLDEQYNRNPGDFVAMGDEDDAKYVARFARGELTAYIVSVVEDRYNGEILGSLSGVDVETADALGTFRSLDTIEDGYLREVAVDVLAEVDGRAAAAARKACCEGCTCGGNSEAPCGACQHNHH